MGWFSRKKAQIEEQVPPEDQLHEQWSEVQVPPPDPGRAEGDLTQRMFGMTQACGMTLLVHGAGTVEECFGAACSAAPALERAEEVGGGIGTVAGNPAHIWMIAAGPTSALLACFLTPDADIDFFTTQLSDRLQRIKPPWRLSMIMRTSGSWPQTAATSFAEATALPMWTLERFAHLQPRKPAETDTRPGATINRRPVRKGSHASRPAAFGNLAGADFLVIERVRHNPPDDSFDNYERVNELGRRLQSDRKSGFEYTVRDPNGHRVDPDWLSTRSFAVNSSGLVLSASHLNHSALGRPPALDLGAIDLRNLNTWRADDRPRGMVSPHHSLYRGIVNAEVHVPLRMVADTISVDLHPSGLGVVGESWGGSAGAVAAIDMDGGYRHLTFLEGLSGGESIQLSPDGSWALLDGGGRAWLVDTETGYWMPSPICNAGWWPGRDSCLVSFRESQPLTPYVFDLAQNREIEELPTIRFDQLSGVDFLDRGWRPRVSADGRRMLLLTAAGVPAESQQEHGTGNRVGIVDIFTGRCELVTKIFLDSHGELERDHVEARWLDDRWRGQVNLHPELSSRLQPPAALPTERDDPEWLASDPRQLGGLALEAVVETLQADPAGADASRLMPEIIHGLVTTANLHKPSWQAVSEWASNIADFIGKPVAKGWLNHASQDAWTKYIDAVVALNSDRSDSVDLAGLAWTDDV